ncbi:MAG TPA: type II toxin-antitoxin system VapC family toxin [Azospirillum sp.]
MFLLDSNALSELRRPDRANAGLAAWAAGALAAELFISAITLFELELGVAQAERRDAAKGKVLRIWLDSHVVPAFGGRIIPVDAAVAQRCAALHVPDPRPQRDSLIAATALVHRLVVVTRNVRDFEPMGVRFLNPWNDG